MTRSRRLVLALIPLALAAAPAPAGIEARGCGQPQIRDPEIRASFERFDRNQSAAAQMVCGISLTDLDVAFSVR